jgi:hypothetical protein
MPVVPCQTQGMASMSRLRLTCVPCFANAQASPTCAMSTTGDGIYEPFEPEMDYSAFGLKLLEDQIPVLHEAIAAVSDEDFRRKQVGVSRLRTLGVSRWVCRGCGQQARWTQTQGLRAGRRLARASSSWVCM